MAFYWYVWTPRAERKIAQHGITREEFEYVVENPERIEISRTSDRLVAIGETPARRRLCCVFDMADDATVVPVTGYDV